MSLLSGKTNSSATKRLMGYYPQSSIHGGCIPVVYGTMRLSGNIIHVFDWKSSPAASGGKSGGKGASGKGGQQYQYFANFIIGLCMGPIKAVSTCWLNRTVYKPSVTSEIFTIPVGGGPVAVSSPGFFIDTGVQKFSAYSTTVNNYGSPGAATIAGTQAIPFTRVASAPASGQYSHDALGNYTFNAADAGIVVEIGYAFTALGGAAIPPPYTTLNFFLFVGNAGQAAWTTPPAGQQLGYTQLAYLGTNQRYPLDTSGLIPNFSWEIVGKLVFPGAGVMDCDPLAIFSDFILDPAYGANWNPALLGSLTEASGYAVANSLFCSALYDSQRSAASWLAELLIIANAEAVWSDATLKLRSRGDTTAVGNGVTFSPTTQPIYDLDDDDFISKPGEEPVEFDLPTAQDAYNSLKVEWSNRGNGYQAEPIPAQDDYAIQLYGIREASQISLHGITEHVVAAKVAAVQLKKLVYERGTAKFTLGMHYCLLEPMDMVTVTDPGLGFVKQPFRISTIGEDEHGQLAIEAIIFPWSISQPTLHPKQTTGGYSPAYSAHPGSVNAPIFFEAPQQLTQKIGLVIFILLSGGPNWGGCSIYESADNVSYDFVARHAARSADGVLTSTLPWSADPDTGDTLAVDLVGSIGALESFTPAQADKFQSLALVDHELVAYTTATLGMGYQYNLTGYLRRGLFGTNATSHAPGSRFAALDGSEFEDTYQTTDIGKTRWYKFTSFNLAGQQEEDVSAVTAYPWSIQAPYTRGPLAIKPYAENYAYAPSGYGFKLSQIQGQSGSQSIAISGAPPVNVFSQALTAPVSDSIASVTAHVGNVLATGNWLAQVFAVDSAGLYGPPSNLTGFTVTVLASRAAFNVVLPAGTARYELFIGRDLDSFYGQGIQTGTPGTINIDSISQAGYGPPDARAVAWHATGRRTQHAGIASAVVISSTFSTVVIGVPSAALVDQYAGRDLIVVSKVGLPTTQQFSVIPIIHSDVGNPNCTLTVGAPGVLASPGDLVLISTAASAATQTSITDSGFVSPFAPGGLTAHAEIGNMIKVLYDPTGSAIPGDEVKILDNTSIGYTVTPFQSTPGIGTYFIEVEATLRADVVTAAQMNAVAPVGSALGSTPLASIPAADLQGYVALVDLRAQDADGNDSPETGDSFRMMYIVPAPSAADNGPVFTVPNVGNVFTPDLSQGLNQRVLLVADSTLNATVNGPTSSSATWTLIVDEDSTGLHNLVFDPSYFYNANLLGTAAPSTRSQSNWILDQAGHNSLSGTPSTDQPIPA